MELLSVSPIVNPPKRYFYFLDKSPECLASLSKKSVGENPTRILIALYYIEAVQKIKHFFKNIFFGSDTMGP
jgi:hypothetical protein